MTYVDIYDFFITRTSVYTKNQLKAYKSLDAYHYFADGWIKEMKYAPINQFIVVIAKVSYIFWIVNNNLHLI